jgi:catechol 2,3-dioxygenase-like lactoylglutathione lyase family enzyme
MRIRPSSLFVDDQDKALRFSTDVLGFVKKTEVPVGTDVGSPWSHRKTSTAPHPQLPRAIKAGARRRSKAREAAGSVPPGRCRAVPGDDPARVDPEYLPAEPALQWRVQVNQLGLAADLQTTLSSVALL